MGAFLNRYGLIVVKLKKDASLEEIVKRLQLKLVIEDQVLLIDAVQEDEYRIGKFNDILIICTEEIFHFFLETFDNLPKKLMSSLSKEKMSAVYYYSVSGIDGYSYFEKGKRIRTYYIVDDKLLVNIGDELDVEKEEFRQKLRESADYPFVDDVQGSIIQKTTDIELNVLLNMEIKMTKFEIMNTNRIK